MILDVGDGDHAFNHGPRAVGRMIVTACSVERDPRKTAPDLATWPKKQRTTEGQDVSSNRCSYGRA